MKFKVLQKTYINDTLHDKGEIIEVDEDQLAKDKKGNIDFSKHSSLEPLDKKAAEAAAKAKLDAHIAAADGVDPDEDDEDNEPEAELSDAEKAQAIKDALETLDPDEDAHWTKKGLADVNTVEEILGFDVTRADIEAAAPDFTRPQSE